MKPRLQRKMLLIQIILEWKVSMNEKTRLKPSFRYPCRFMSGSLALRLRRTFFRALFGFCNIQATFCFLQKLGAYSFDFTLNLLCSLCACTLQFVFPSLLKSTYKSGIIYSEEITTTTITTTTATTKNMVNAYSGSGPVIQIVGQGRKYIYKLRRQAWCMQTQALDW